MGNIREESLNNINETSNCKSTTNKKVLIIIEDTGNAYNLYRDYLIKNFSISNTDIIGVGGADRFFDEIKQRINYDAYIVIYDAGAEISKISNAIAYIKDNNNNAEIHTFTPNCFEEVLLSFSKIQPYINKNNNNNTKIFKQLQLVIRGMLEDVDYIESKEQTIERILEELTKDTVFQYVHYSKQMRKSLMSDCWLYDCCNINTTEYKNKHISKLKNKCTKMKLNGENNKLALMTKYSLLGGLKNILVEVFEIQGIERELPNMLKYSELVGRIN